MLKKIFIIPLFTLLLIGFAPAKGMIKNDLSLLMFKDISCHKTMRHTSEIANFVISNVCEEPRNSQEYTVGNIKQQQSYLWQINKYVLIVLLSIISILFIIYVYNLKKNNRASNIQDDQQNDKEYGLKSLNYIYTQNLESSQIDEIVNNQPNELFIRLEQLMVEERLFTKAKLSRTDVASHLGTNVTYLYNALREARGDQSFTEYINLHRLNYACKLLIEDPEANIESIALKSGFNSRQTFYRFFKEQFGLTPIEYRKSNIQSN